MRNVNPSDWLPRAVLLISVLVSGSYASSFVKVYLKRG